MKPLTLLGLLLLAAVVPKGVDHFDTMPVGAAPLGWKCGDSGAGGPKWSVTRDDSAPTRPNVLRVSGPGDFPWCVKPDVVLREGFVEVTLKALSGEEDQAGGVVWRWKDDGTYYIARANALEQNVTLFRFVDGHRRAIKNTDVPVSARAWHKLRVEFEGVRVRVFFDGKRVIDAEDVSISGAGAVGVWSKADSATLFDGFSYGPKS
ncbi:MAG: hypothetical protein ACT4TC_11330 [Myxococcaceae bacterium]